MPKVQQFSVSVKMEQGFKPPAGFTRHGNSEDYSKTWRGAAQSEKPGVKFAWAYHHVEDGVLSVAGLGMQCWALARFAKYEKGDRVESTDNRKKHGI